MGSERFVCPDSELIVSFRGLMFIECLLCIVHVFNSG